MKNIKIIRISHFKDTRGELGVFEGLSSSRLNIDKIQWLNHLFDKTKTFSSQKILLIQIKGSLEIEISSESSEFGLRSKSFSFNNFKSGLLIEPKTEIFVRSVSKDFIGFMVKLA